jgi:hypothetical protein
LADGLYDAQGNTEWAYKLAKQAVNCAPSEFVTWAKLTEVNIEMKRYDEALRTLNSCVMFTYNERDLHRMPTPQRTHLPIKPYITDSGILASLENGESDNEADLALLRLPAPSLRGTFKKAYELLCKLVGQIGWDELLRTRSEVFVMEEEYRMQKQLQDDVSDVDGEAAVQTEQQSQADDDASTRGVRESATANLPSPQPNGFAGTPKTSEPPASPIPEIRISRHSEDNPSAPSAQFSAAPQVPPVEEVPEDVDLPKSDLNGPAPGVEKPPVTHLSNTAESQPNGGAEDVAEQPSTIAGQPQTPVEAGQNATANGTSSRKSGQGFTTKRLCERWLDNLFMVLYEVRPIAQKW